MCRTPYNDYLNNRIDAIHDAVVAMKPFELLMVWVDERFLIVTEKQHVLPGFGITEESVGFRADMELERAGVVDE